MFWGRPLRLCRRLDPEGRRSCCSSLVVAVPPLLLLEPPVEAITSISTRPKTTRAAGASMRSELRCSASIAGGMVLARQEGSGRCPGGGPQLLRGRGRGLGGIAATLAVGVDNRARGCDEARRG